MHARTAQEATAPPPIRRRTSEGGADEVAATVGTKLVFAVAMLGRSVAWRRRRSPALRRPRLHRRRRRAPPPAAAEAPAPVAEESEYVRRGWYAQLGFIYAPSAFKLDNAESQLPPSRIAGESLSRNNKFGLDARVGYRLRPRWAVEGTTSTSPASRWNGAVGAVAHRSPERPRPVAAGQVLPPAGHLPALPGGRRGHAACQRRRHDPGLLG